MQIVNIITQYYPSFLRLWESPADDRHISALRHRFWGLIFDSFKVSDFKVLKLVADVYIDIYAEHPCWCRS